MGHLSSRANFLLFKRFAMFRKEMCETLPLSGKLGLAGDPSARDKFSSHKRDVFCSIIWKTEIKKYSGTPLLRPALGHKTLVVIVRWSH